MGRHLLDSGKEKAKTNANTHTHTLKPVEVFCMIFLSHSINQSQRCNYLSRIPLLQHPKEGVWLFVVLLNVLVMVFLKAPSPSTCPPLKFCHGVKQGKERPRGLKSYLRAGSVLRGHLINSLLSPMKHLHLRELKQFS